MSTFRDTMIRTIWVRRLSWSSTTLDRFINFIQEVVAFHGKPVIFQQKTHGIIQGGRTPISIFFGSSHFGLA